MESNSKKYPKLAPDCWWEIYGEDDPENMYEVCICRADSHCKARRRGERPCTQPKIFGGRGIKLEEVK